MHASMEQMGTQGELGPKEIQATMSASIMYKIHKGSFNAKYAWDSVRKENPDLLVPMRQMGADDLWQWVMYENLDQ